MATKGWKVVVGLGLLMGVMACAIPPMRPDRFLDVREAFPSPADVEPPAGHPAVRRATFGAAYEDVYRAASVSASQAQFVVEEEQKARGLILATRAAMMVPRGTDTNAPTQHRYFYAITLRELGPKSTEVRISAKVQGQCRKVEGGMGALVNIGTAGMVSGMIRDSNAYCDALSSGMWAAGNHMADEDLGRFLTFVRNNLIAAGAI